MDNEHGIEAIGQENGQTFWWAHVLSDFLGYATYDSFQKVVRRAMRDAESIGIDAIVEFEPAKKDGKNSYKLTRFAVMLCVAQSDSKKEPVQQAKIYLTSIAEHLFREVTRINEREKLKGNEKMMVDTAVRHGLSKERIGIFKDSGYRGLYNMGVSQLKEYKGVKNFKGTLYDLMNPVELAANSFRTAMTSEKIRNDNITDSNQIISAAQSVGHDVRKIVVENTGKNPEDIELEEERINRVVTRVKKQGKQINQRDANSPD